MRCGVLVVLGGDDRGCKGFGSGGSDLGDEVGDKDGDDDEEEGDSGGGGGNIEDSGGFGSGGWCGGYGGRR